jgi:hypothetical protein
VDVGYRKFVNFKKNVHLKKGCGKIFWEGRRHGRRKRCGCGRRGWDC